MNRQALLMETGLPDEWYASNEHAILYGLEDASLDVLADTYPDSQYLGWDDVQWYCSARELNEAMAVLAHFPGPSGSYWHLLAHAAVAAADTGAGKEGQITALDGFARAEKLAAEMVTWHLFYFRAYTYAAMSQFEEAWRDAQRALLFDAEAPLLRMAAGEFAIHTDRFEEAESALAFEAPAGLAGLHLYLRAQLAWRQLNDAQALELCREGLALNPKDMEARTLLLKVLLDSEQYVLLEAELEQIPEGGLDAESLQMFRALAASRQGRWLEAEQLMSALERIHQEKESAAEYALVLLELDQHGAAVEHLMRVRHTGNGDSLLLDCLLICALHLSGNSQLAYDLTNEYRKTTGEDGMRLLWEWFTYFDLTGLSPN